MTKQTSLKNFQYVFPQTVLKSQANNLFFSHPLENRAEQIPGVLLLNVKPN